VGLSGARFSLSAFAFDPPKDSGVKTRQAEEAAENSSLLSSRAKRGICFFANRKEKADSSGKLRPRNDTFGIFPQPVKPVLFNSAGARHPRG
jgi:hypothetical protein